MYTVTTVFPVKKKKVFFFFPLTNTIWAPIAKIVVRLKQESKLVKF